MLEKFTVHATIPCSDFDRAKAWYREKLGLTPASEDAGGAYYECGDGTSFGLFPTPYAGTAKNTQMEWSVPDIHAVVDELNASGVTFERFDYAGRRLGWRHRRDGSVQGVLVQGQRGQHHRHHREGGDLAPS